MSKSKQKVFGCGKCHWCGKEHLSNEGGWVINAERKNFCHYEDGCYDKYFKACKEIAHQQTTEGIYEWNKKVNYLLKKEKV